MPTLETLWRMVNALNAQAVISATNTSKSVPRLSKKWWLRFTSHAK